MTGDTRHINAMHTGEVQRRQRLAVHLRIGNQDALRYQWLVLLLKVNVQFRTDKCHDSLLVSLCTYYQHLVAQVENSVAVGNAQFSFMDQS